jgi:hypothetical protein
LFPRIKPNIHESEVKMMLNERTKTITKRFEVLSKTLSILEKELEKEPFNTTKIAALTEVIKALKD